MYIHCPAAAWIDLQATWDAFNSESDLCKHCETIPKNMNAYSCKYTQLAKIVFHNFAFMVHNKNERNLKHIN